MKYMNKSIEELHNLLKTGEVTSEELIKESLALSHEIQEKYNAFVTILDEAKPTKITDNLLSGIPYGIKDNYSTKGILSTGSSNSLKDYIPYFNATAIENLNKAGAVPVNKTVLDEFGMGGTGTTGHTGVVKNPWDPKRMCAGSSSGSAAAVAAGVYGKYKAETKDETKTVIASTASPFKFTRSVMDAIDEKYDSMTDFELVDELSKIANVKAPQAIEDIRSAAVLHKTVCEVDEMPKVVKEFLEIR